VDETEDMLELLEIEELEETYVELETMLEDLLEGVLLEIIEELDFGGIEVELETTDELEETDVELETMLEDFDIELDELLGVGVGTGQLEGFKEQFPLMMQLKRILVGSVTSYF